MSLFHTDQPISGDENTPDRLGRQAFARKVGQSFMLGVDSPGLVVSLEGPWGYGKTSVINMIARFLDTVEDTPRPVVVTFNPWVVTGTENMLQEFLVQMATAVGRDDLSYEALRVAGQLLKYAKFFAMRERTTDAEPWATIMRHAAERVGETAEAVGRLEDLSVETQHERVAEAIRALHRPIVVFIDDMDRLPPDDIFQLIRIVKAVADFPRICFVLAFDPECVSPVLEGRGIADPAMYLDRIINVRLPIPAIESDTLHAVVEEELKTLPPTALVEHFPGNNRRLSELYHLSIRHLLRSPGDVKRLFNNVRMREVLVRGEVELADIVGLEALRLRAPRIYEHICSEPEMYTGVEEKEYGGLENQDEKPAHHAAVRKRLLDELRPEDAQHAQKLIEDLFPFTRGRDDGFSQKSYSARGLVAAMDRLMILIGLGLPSQSVPISVVRDFLSRDELRKKICERVCRGRTVERFLDLLREAIGHSPVFEPAGFVTALADLVEHPVAREIDAGRQGVMSVSLMVRTWWVVEECLGKLERPKRVECLELLMASARWLTLGTFGLECCLRQNDAAVLHTAISDHMRWCTEMELEEMKSSWIATATSNFSRDGIFSLNGRAHIFALLRKLAPERVPSLVPAMLADDRDLDALVSSIGATGRDPIKGLYAEITAQFLDSIGGAGLIKRRVERRLTSPLSMGDTERVVYHGIVTGRRIYLSDILNDGVSVKK